MQKQKMPSIKAHLTRGAFYSLLLLAVSVIPFALAQRTTFKRSMAGNRIQAATALNDSGRASAVAGALPRREIFGFEGFPTATATATATATPTPGPCLFRVLIAYTDVSGQPSTIRNEILGELGVGEVDFWDCFFTIPTLAQLLQYNIVYAFSYSGWSDPVAMGNVLADYEDAGGVVVVGAVAWLQGGSTLAGRWMTGGYSPYNLTNVALSSNNMANITNPGHPLMQGVNSLSASYRTGVTLATGATSVADWTDGPPAVAYQTNNGHTAVGLNAYLGHDHPFAGEWGRVIVNTGRWLAPLCQTPSPTPTATFAPTSTPTATATATATPSAAPCSVTGINPACFSTVDTRRLIDFAVFVSDPVDPATLQPSDLMCNGIPASAVAYTPGSTTISFHFGNPPLMQGLNTMHIAAGAFNCVNGQPVVEFMCTLTGVVPREPSPRPRPSPAPRPTP